MGEPLDLLVVGGGLDEAVLARSLGFRDRVRGETVAGILTWMASSPVGS